eukprot:jgi/Orpsp1_1/1175794/evm.model.c7180000055227.1
MKLKDITNVFGSKKNDQLKIRSRKDKSIKRKLTNSMTKKLNRMSGIICDPAKTIGLETELKLSPAITVHYTSKIIDVAKVMSVKDNTTCVLVIDDRGQLCGILTDKDIVFRVLATGMDPKRTAVHTVMTSNPVTATLETAKRVAMQAIYTGAFWHIPIISENDSSSVVKTNVIGMINLNELFGRDIIEKLQQTPSFMELSSSVPSASDNSFAYSEFDMISRYEEIRQQKLTVVLDQHEESPPEIDGKMNVSIASNIMKIYKKGAVIVCDTDSRSLLGILTTQDLILRVVAAGRYPASTSAKSVMTPNPPVVNPNKQVSKTLKYMLDNNYKYIVIGADLKITGIVDILEVTRAALQQLQERDEIEEDARSRRSFSEDGSYYESSKLMHRSSRSTLQSFEDSDKQKNVPHIKIELTKNDNILNGINDEEEDSDEVRPTFLPRDVSLMNNIITETIPELDEEKELDINDNNNNNNNNILDDLNDSSEIIPKDIMTDNDNNASEPNVESIENNTIEDDMEQYGNDENIPVVSLPVIKIKLDPDMDKINGNQNIVEETHIENNENVESGEIKNNMNEVIEPNEVELKVKEIILPNEIENNINEIIEQNDIEASITESIKPNDIEISEEIIDPNEYIKQNEIIEQNENVKNDYYNETDNIELINIPYGNGNDIEQNHDLNINNISNNDTGFEEVEINDNDNNNNNNNNNNEINNNEPIQPEIIINNEFVNPESSEPNINNNIANPINNEFLNIPYQDISEQLDILEASVKNYQKQENKASILFSNENQDNKRDVATIDAILAQEVNDEGIHNIAANKTFQEIDNFIVSNNNNNNNNIEFEDLQGSSSNYYDDLNISEKYNIIENNEPEVSEEAKRFVDNIIESNDNVPEFNEIITENEKVNTTEEGIYNDIYNDNNVNSDNLELLNNTYNEQEINNNSSYQNVNNDENQSPEFREIKVQYDDENEKLVESNILYPNEKNNDNNEVYDLSTIMPSSPQMSIDKFNYQNRSMPSLDLNESMEKSEAYNINNNDINSSINAQDSFSMNLNNNETTTSVPNNEYLYRKSEFKPITSNEIEEDLSTTLQNTQEHEDNENNKSGVMETIALDSESNIILDHNQEEPVLERGNLIEFDKSEEQKDKAPPKSVLEYIRQIVAPNVISHIFRYSLDKSQLDDALTLNNGDNSTTMLVKRVVGGRDLYEEEERRYNERDDSSSTVLYPSQYLNTSQKRISLSRLAATQSIIKEEDLLLKCFDQETEQVYRINYNNDTKYEDVVNTIIKKSEIEDKDTLLFGYLDEDRDFIKIESEEDFLQGIWLARKLLWGRLFIVIKRKNKSSLMSILPWGNRSAVSNANNDQGNWLNNAMLIGVGIAATLAVKKISS